MDLLVDIGNTRFKWCCAEHGVCGEATSQQYDRSTLSAVLRDHWGGLAEPQRVIVANVAGDAGKQAVIDAAQRLWQLDADFIKAQRRANGVTNGYLRPGKLGADRWAAIIAAHALFPGTKYIVDCGTAVTIDAVDEGGTHLGGLIIPGLTMMRRALIGGASDLVLNDDQDTPHPPTLLADETSNAVKAGTLRALIAVVDRTADELEAERACTLTRVITGGNARLLQPLLAGGYTHEPDLVLKGLSVIAGDAR